MTKFLGRYLRNNGAESIWRPNSVFGPNVVQSVLDGTYYVRSFKVMLFHYETMEMLQYSKDEETMDRECQIIKEKNGSAASNYVFQCSQWQHAIMPLLNFTDDNYFISIIGKPNDTNKHHLPHRLRVM